MQSVYRHGSLAARRMAICQYTGTPVAGLHYSAIGWRTLLASVDCRSTAAMPLPLAYETRHTVVELL